jgi:hypothetical protein
MAPRLRPAVAALRWTPLIPPSSPAARIATRLLLAGALLVIVSAAMATGKTAATAYDAPAPSTPLLASTEPGDTGRDDASCVKAPPALPFDESGAPKSEAEPELTLPGSTPACAGPLFSVLHGFHDAARISGKAARLSRGPPLQA